MKVKAPSEKNFRRAKVRPGRKKGWRSWISWRHVAAVAAAVLITYSGYRALALVASASTLQVRKIAVHGNVRLSSGEVEALLEGLRGKSILTVDLEARRRSLLQSPWVGDVALRRVLPSTIDVLVSERRPMGLCRLGADLYLVDGTGVVIDQYGPQYAEFDLPIVDGLVRAPGGKTQPAIDEERAALAARVMAALAARRGLGAQVSQIDVSDAHDAIVLLDGDPALLHLGDERFAERLQAYLELAPTLHERVPDIDYVDLRFEERVYVRPAPGSAKPGSGAKDKSSPAAVRKF